MGRDNVFYAQAGSHAQSEFALIFRVESEREREQRTALCEQSSEQFFRHRFSEQFLRNFDAFWLIAGMDLLEENKALKNELSLLSEKFHLMQVLHQNQSKLIELFLRLEMIRECNDQDKKETDDLQRKIQLCVGVIEEYNVKYSELCNDKRRAVIVSTNEPGMFCCHCCVVQFMQVTRCHVF